MTSRKPGGTEGKLRGAEEQISKNLSGSAARIPVEELLIDLADNRGSATRPVELERDR